MNIDNYFIENYLKELGPSGFSLFIFLKYLSKDKKIRVRLKKLTCQTGLSKPLLIQQLKTLRRQKLVLIEIKVENGKKCIYLKTLKTSKIFLPLYPINNIININKNIRTSKEYNNLKKIHDDIISKILKFRRFDNDYYRNRKYPFREKEQKHISNFISNIGEKRIDDYIDWWLKNKASRIPGLNIGLVLCQPMMEEFMLKNGKSIIPKKERAGPTSLEKEMIQSLLEEVNKGNSELNNTDKEFLDECEKKNYIKKNKDKYELNF